MKDWPGRILIIVVVFLMAVAVFGDRVFDAFDGTAAPAKQAASASGLLSAPTTTRSLSVSSTTTTARTTTTTQVSTTTSASTTIPTTTTTVRDDVTVWSDALDHVGEKVTVEGPVVGTSYARSSNGSPTFLNVGRDYPDPDRFTVIIWVQNRDRFPSAPEDAYRGKTIRVTGTVAVYKGSAQIEAKSSSQIEIVN